MAKIVSIHAREILDSRGNPTVEVDLRTEKSFARAAVPSGASTGVHEACELRDGGEKFGGKGVSQAVANVNGEIADAIVGLDSADQKAIDEKMKTLDGTPNLSRLGANAILGVSLAAAHATRLDEGICLFEHFGRLAGNEKWLLPTPMANIINGGAHADNPIDIQEFMIVPTGFTKFSDGLRAMTEVFHALKKILQQKNLATNVGDEGGFAPNLQSTEEACEAILAAVEAAGYAGKFKLAIDAASSEFFSDGVYKIEGRELSAAELVDFYAGLVEKFPIASIEDGCAEDDWAGWKLITEKLGDKIQIVGDDLFVTNPVRLQKGIDEGVANSILIKLNQIGTVSDTIAAVQLAQQKNYTAVISHRSGETADTTIADFAVGVAAGQIKTGSLCRTDRVAKYNQLLRIEEKLGNAAVYAGDVFAKN